MSATTSMRHAARSPQMKGFARLGLAARATIYLLIGWLALLLATGKRQGLTHKFEKYLDLNRMSPTTRRVVRFLGTVGTAARGVVFMVAGFFVLRAAYDFDPKKARELDGALRSLADTSAGPWLLGAAALGLIAFGVYGYAQAVWRRT